MQIPIFQKNRAFLFLPLRPTTFFAKSCMSKNFIQNFLTPLQSRSLVDEQICLNWEIFQIEIVMQQFFSMKFWQKEELYFILIVMQNTFGRIFLEMNLVCIWNSSVN
jgi:hypothetical protein